MPWLPSGSVDMILCDLPYGTTACKWDTVIPFEPLWAEYKRVIKPNGAIVLFGSQPFTSALVMSNVAWFRHGWVWLKNKASGHLNAKVMPMRAHEDVVVFGCSKVPYFPQMTSGHAPGNYAKRGKQSACYGVAESTEYGGQTVRYPKSFQEFPIINNDDPDKTHPTQKPVALCEYLIKTYTNEGETVLDNCAGSFTTGVAALNTNRKFIGIEQDSGYFDIGVERMKVRMAEVVLTQNPLFSYGMTGRGTQDSKSDSPLLA
jgi:site-specific DNA-methyltransferase (adenine-specific)